MIDSSNPLLTLNHHAPIGCSEHHLWRFAVELTSQLNRIAPFCS
jgi:hypothetical protein